MKKEKGFTLVELLMATAISGLIVGVLGTAIYQIISVAEYGNDRLTAMHELQNATHWVGLDGQQAISASGGSELVLTLSDGSAVTYSLIGAELQRTADGRTLILAQNITSANFSAEEHAITINLISSPSGRHSIGEQGTYRVYLRPAGGGG